ncbi:MAG: alanine--tRNA ligase [Gammaproteobacteria bacterium]|jgi:alanyl-tRNA synthetase|nr:alanine--tRNA ligase [Gammaproteobacteria bacterium]
MKTTADLRRGFLDYFRERGHEIVPSSPLVPANDPTLLFTNAGMVQFKDLFLGRETRSYTRAASSQRCVRAGGKHNDLENVGYTARHHTFFEMLGNFSFGDYFKREAIEYAWDFLTRVLDIPEERLWVTVYEEDDEAAEIWLNELGVSADRFRRIGASDNFWTMGDTGPCGPCSEIFYDHGSAVFGGPPGSPDAEGDRYVEVWNLVFTQYGRDTNGTLNPISNPSIDTGMGLERLAAVMQGVHNNYDIDLFRHLTNAVVDLVQPQDPESPSVRVIADHIRSCAFLISDGVLPANEGRGYVLRRIIRRAVRHGHALGLREPFFNRLVTPLADVMGDAYPELVEARTRVEQALLREETRFAETLDQGLRILEEDVSRLSGEVIPGETIFRLYDTYGFPADLTADIARERGLQLDMAGFEQHMAAQRERARRASRFGSEQALSLGDFEGETRFTGYDGCADEGTVIALYRDGAAVESLGEGEQGVVFLDRTPFYAESGGQVGDIGTLSSGESRFRVSDTQKQGAAHAHMGGVESGAISVGQRLDAEVDRERRQSVVLNHSATHLLHAALRTVLGTHVTQKGSLVAPDRLRFDFSHPDPVTQEELTEIERLVNREIRANAAASARVVDMDKAMELGAMALFGEKYGDEVRVLSIGDFSTELCGGTHVERAGDIGLLKIISETGISAGVRRIEAVTGQGALDWIDQHEKTLERVAELVKGARDEVGEKVGQLVARTRVLEKELDRLKAGMARQTGSDLAARAVDVAGIKVLAAAIDGADPKSLRETADQLKNKLGESAVVLATVRDGKVNLVAGVSKGSTGLIRAGDLVNEVARQVGGRGGGRPDMAQAGGNDPSALQGALQSVPAWVESQLGNS